MQCNSSVIYIYSSMPKLQWHSCNVTLCLIKTILRFPCKLFDLHLTRNPSNWRRIKCTDEHLSVGAHCYRTVTFFIHCNDVFLPRLGSMMFCFNNNINLFLWYWITAIYLSMWWMLCLVLFNWQINFLSVFNTFVPKRFGTWRCTQSNVFSH